MSDFKVSIDGDKKLSDQLKRIEDSQTFLDDVFIQVTNESIRNLVKGSQGKGLIKTGNTARAWRRVKKGASSYVLENDASSLDGKHLIANILNYGHGEIRPVKAKMLYIPLTEKGANRGGGYKKGLERGVDYVLALKVKKTIGTKFMDAEQDRAQKDLVTKILAKVKGVFQ